LRGNGGFDRRRGGLRRGHRHGSGLARGGGIGSRGLRSGRCHISAGVGSVSLLLGRLGLRLGIGNGGGRLAIGHFRLVLLHHADRGIGEGRGMDRIIDRFGLVPGRKVFLGMGQRSLGLGGFAGAELGRAELFGGVDLGLRGGNRLAGAFGLAGGMGGAEKPAIMAVAASSGATSLVLVIERTP
jgi:hypothetical protein